MNHQIVKLPLCEDTLDVENDLDEEVVGRWLGSADRSSGQTQQIVTALFDWLGDVGFLQLIPAVGLIQPVDAVPKSSPAFYRPSIRL
ncbi:hypothetical protein [Paraburkholderia sp. XV]|nr:hypothetical protein [Paraburkholderia sp. XV]